MRNRTRTTAATTTRVTTTAAETPPMDTSLALGEQSIIIVVEVGRAEGKHERMEVSEYVEEVTVAEGRTERGMEEERRRGGEEERK